jgi:hypothetical protein
VDGPAVGRDDAEQVLALVPVDDLRLEGWAALLGDLDRHLIVRPAFRPADALARALPGSLSDSGSAA